MADRDSADGREGRGGAMMEKVKQERGETINAGLCWAFCRHIQLHAQECLLGAQVSRCKFCNAAFYTPKAR